MWDRLTSYATADFDEINEKWRIIISEDAESSLSIEGFKGLLYSMLAGVVAYECAEEEALKRVYAPTTPQPVRDAVSDYFLMTLSSSAKECIFKYKTETMRQIYEIDENENKEYIADAILEFRIYTATLNSCCPKLGDQFLSSVFSVGYLGCRVLPEA